MSEKTKTFFCQNFFFVRNYSFSHENCSFFACQKNKNTIATKKRTIEKRMRRCKTCGNNNLWYANRFLFNLKENLNTPKRKITYYILPVIRGNFGHQILFLLFAPFRLDRNKVT